MLAGAVLHVGRDRVFEIEDDYIGSLERLDVAVGTVSGAEQPTRAS